MKKDIEIQTITPVHIGSGNLLKANTEYLNFQEENKLAVIDDEKIYHIIGKDGIDKWLSIVENNQDLLDYLRQRKKGLTSADVAKRVIPVKGKKARKDLREHILTAFGKPMMPGSSIKGAVRTAFFRKLLYQTEKGFVHKNLSDQNEKIRKKPKQNFKDTDLQKDFFGPNPNYDFMRLLRIGDLNFNRTIGILAQTLNEKKGGEFTMKPDGENYIEAIPEGDKAQGRIQIADSLKDLINKMASKKDERKLQDLSSRSKNLNSLNHLFKLINNHTIQLIDNELGLYEDLFYDFPEDAENFYEELENLKKSAEECADDSCIMRLGFGSGYHFMTGDWLDSVTENDDKLYKAIANKARRDFKGKYSRFDLPKTRKMALNGQPLGFVKMKIL